MNTIQRRIYKELLEDAFRIEEYIESIIEWIFVLEEDS